MIAKIEGPAFKQLVGAVSRFPSLGAFVGSDLVTFRVKDGYLEAFMFGVVVANARVPVEGEIDMCATDERTIVPFASTVAASSVVKMHMEKGMVSFRTRGREIELQIMTGKDQEIPPVDGVKLKLSGDNSDKLKYLAAVAMSDPAKPELCCVMVAGGQAYACNSKAIAVLDCKISGHKGKTALPVPLLKSLAKGDTITVGKSTVLESGVGKYMMPTPTQAQEGFPLTAIQQYSEGKKVKIATVKGEHLSSGLEECSACLAGVSRGQVIVKLSIKDNKIDLYAKNGGVVFRRVLPCESVKTAELLIPLEEAMLALPLFSSKEVHVYVGKNDETILSFADGWLLFPSWSPAK